MSGSDHFCRPLDGVYKDLVIFQVIILQMGPGITDLSFRFIGKLQKKDLIEFLIPLAVSDSRCGIYSEFFQRQKRIGRWFFRYCGLGTLFD